MARPLLQIAFDDASQSNGPFEVDRSVKFAVDTVRDGLSRQQRVFLLYGPPGAGKSAFAQQVAAILSAPFLDARVSDQPHPLTLTAPDGQSVSLTVSGNVALLLPELLAKPSVIAFDETGLTANEGAALHDLLEAASAGRRLLLRDDIGGDEQEIAVDADTVFFAAFAPGVDDPRLDSMAIGDKLAVRYDRRETVHERTARLERLSRYGTPEDADGRAVIDDFLLQNDIHHDADAGTGMLPFEVSRLREYAEREHPLVTVVHAGQAEADGMADAVSSRLQQWASDVFADDQPPERAVVERAFSGAELAAVSDVYATLIQDLPMRLLHDAPTRQQIVDFAAHLIWTAAVNDNASAFEGSLCQLQHIMPVGPTGADERVALARVLGPLGPELKGLAARLRYQGQLARETASAAG